MKQHLTSLEVSKELAKILPEGFESKFVYIEDELYVTAKDGLPMSLKTGHRIAITTRKITPALLLTEVLGVLPAITKTQFINYSLILDIHSKRIAYETQNCDGSIEELKGTEHYFDKTNIATAAARLAIWLVENGYELEVANE